MTTHSYGDFVNCPWCGHPTDVCDYELYRDGEQCTAICDSCKKPVIVTVHTRKTYTCEPAYDGTN